MADQTPTKITKTEAAPKAAAKVKATKPKVAKADPPEAAAEPLPVDTEVKAKKDKAKDKDRKKEKKKKKAKKEAVLIRFEDGQLQAIADQADALGLSRSAWVRMVVAKALAG